MTDGFKGRASSTGALLLYLLTIPAANWAVSEWPEAWVGPGLVAPAGVYFAGAALVLRDWAREAAGKTAVQAAMAAGVVLSFWFADPTVAFASAAAFALAETLDYFVYERLRERGKQLALGASNAVGIAADSVVFLLLAFGSLQYLPGQLLGKAWVTVLALAAMGLWRRRRAAA